MSMDASNQRTVAALESMGGALAGDALKAVVGEAVAQLVRAHLVELEASRPNKQGWARQHWYSKAADSTHWTTTPSGARVSIAQDGFRMRVLGGVVRPVTAKALAIPASEEAYGRMARDPVWNGELSYVPLKRGNLVGLLVRRNTPDAEGEVMYRLLRQATIKPDPSLVPDEAAINETVDEALNFYISAAVPK